ncbi:MAG: hypothetical protein ACXWK8_01005 [Myxococcaceae bacterium]
MGPLRWGLVVLLARLGTGCGDAAGNPGQQPDAGGGTNLLSVGGSYDTRVALLPGGTCSGVTVEDAVTTVDHVPGASSLRLTHAGLSHSGTVDALARFQTTARTVVVGPATFRITLAGQFSVFGFEATATVEQTSPAACAYSVQWLGTKSGSPNVIPG